MEAGFGLVCRRLWRVPVLAGFPDGVVDHDLKVVFEGGMSGYTIFISYLAKSIDRV